MSSLISELTVAKKCVEEWKKNLPSYYEPILAPVLNAELIDNPGAYEQYPYTERLDYVTGPDPELLVSNVRVYWSYYEYVPSRYFTNRSSFTGAHVSK
jgi:hypothetical protein